MPKVHVIIVKWVMQLLRNMVKIKVKWVGQIQQLRIKINVK